MAEVGHAEVRDGVPPGELAHGVQLLLSGGEAGLQACDLAEPAVVSGLGDPGFQVVSDLAEAGLLPGVGP